MDHRTNKDPPDEDLVTRSFRELGDRLVGTAYHILGHREDAREVVQDAFVKCWRKRGQAAQVTNLKAWVFSVVLNTARDKRRRTRLRRTDSLPTEDAMGTTSSALNPARVAEHRETLERVRSAIHTLPDREREVFLLRQNGDFSFASIADMVGAPVGTVKTRMRTALRRLREAVETERARGALPRGSQA